MTTINLSFNGQPFSVTAFPYKPLSVSPQFTNQRSQDFVTDVVRILDILGVSHDKQWLQDWIAANYQKVAQSVQPPVESGVDSNTLYTVLLTLWQLMQSAQFDARMTDFGRYFQQQLQSWLQTNVNDDVTATAADYQQRIQDQATEIATNTATINTQDTDMATNAQTITDGATAITTAEQKILDQEQSISDLNAAIAIQTTTLATQSTTINTNATKITKQETDIGTNETTITTGNTTIDTRNGTIASNDAEIAQQESDIAKGVTDIAALQSQLDSRTALVTSNGVIIAGQNTQISSNAAAIPVNNSTLATASQCSLTNSVAATSGTGVIPSLTDTTEVIISARGQTAASVLQQLMLSQAAYSNISSNGGYFSNVRTLILQLFRCLLSSYYVPRVITLVNSYTLTYLDLTLTGNQMSFVQNSAGYYLTLSSVTDSQFTSLGAAVGAQALLKTLVLGLTDIYLSTASMDGLTQGLKNITALTTLILDMRRSTKTDATVSALITNLSQIKNTLQNVSLNIEMECFITNNDYVGAFASQTGILSFTMNATQLTAPSPTLCSSFLKTTRFTTLQKLYLNIAAIPNTQATFNSNDVLAFVAGFTALRLTEFQLVIDQYANSMTYDLGGLPAQIAQQKLLTKINMRFSSLGVTLYQNFFTAFSQLPNLTDFLFSSGNVMTQQTLDSTGTALLNMTQLIRLDMSMAVFSPLDYTIFCSGLQTLVNLKFLNAGSLRISQAYQQMFYNSLQSLQALEETNINIQLGAGDFSGSVVAYSALANCPKLTKLFLIAVPRSGPITSQDNLAFLSMMTTIFTALGSQLTKININYSITDNRTDPTPEFRQSLAGLTAVKDLGITFYPASKQFFTEIQYLTGSPGMQRCQIQGSATSAGTAQDIINTMNCISTFKKLESIYVQSNYAVPGTQGQQSLLDQNMLSPYLIDFYVGYDFAQGDGFYLANIIQRSPYLQRIWFSFPSNCTAQDAQCILSALSRKNLLSLRISLGVSPTWTDSLPLPMINVFKTNKNLRELSFTLNFNFSEANFIAIINSLNFCLQLQSLQIIYTVLTNLTQAGHAALLTMLQNHNLHSSFTTLMISFPNLDATSKANFQAFNTLYSNQYSFSYSN